MDQRRDELAHWAVDIIQQQTELNVNPQLHVVSGDASFRRYFRLLHSDAEGHELSWILVDAPADKEDNPRFVRIAQAWHQHQVAVPQVLAHDFERGFMLLEDFGDALLWPALHADGNDMTTVTQLYSQSIDQLLAIQALPTSDLPAYDQALLDQEMSLFTDWLCTQKLQLTLAPQELTMLRQTFVLLREQALAQPQVVVHRDFHSRNLMIKSDQTLGVIDFQDAVVGGATYDLVSLLRDCYVRWPDALVQELAKEYWQKAQAVGIYPHDWARFKQDFDWMGLQRHLKAAGIFARLHLRDGKDGYLNDIPNTCRYLLEVSADYPQLAAFHQWLQQSFMPALEQHFAAHAIEANGATA